MTELERLNDSQNDDNPEIRQNPKYSLLFKILFLFFIISTITLLIVVIALATKKEESSDKNSDSGGGNNNNNNNDEEEKENAGYKESWNVLYGIKLENLAYADDIINNTFKYGGINYNEEIGIINGGKDYTKNENNIYTLYIPYESLDKTDKYNGVFLFIHGEGEKKENMEHLCRRYAKMGYITATMDYNEAIPNSNTSNAFRIMDEITYCITHIRKILTEEYEFNGNKLELAIGGFSIGAQFTLLYGYSMRNCSPIPIKFLIDTVGYLDPDPNYWYKVAVDNVSLSDLEPESIDEGIKNGTLIRFSDDDMIYLSQMNMFLGNRYTQPQLLQMLDENKKYINYQSELYKSLYKSSKYFFVTYHLNKTGEGDGKFIPILCEYAGNDTNIGVSQFKHLRQLQRIYKNLKFDLVYMRYSNHFLISYNTENGIKAMRDMNKMIKKYAKTYFKDENYEEEEEEQEEEQKDEQKEEQKEEREEEKEVEQEEEKEEETEPDPKNAIGEINLVYQPLMNKATTILSADFEKSTSFSIYEGDKFVKYAKEYKFTNYNKNLKFVIYEDINMDSMFKGVKTLKNFAITSNKNLKIKSIESAFENCEELIGFSIQGVDPK